MFKRIWTKLTKSSKKEEVTNPHITQSVTPQRALALAKAKQNEDFELALKEVLEKIEIESKKGDEHAYIFPDHTKFYKGSMRTEMVSQLETLGFWVEDRTNKNRMYTPSPTASNDWGVLRIQWDQKSLDEIVTKKLHATRMAIGGHTHCIPHHTHQVNIGMSPHIVISGGGMVQPNNCGGHISLNGLYELADNLPLADVMKAKQEEEEKKQKIIQDVAKLDRII